MTETWVWINGYENIYQVSDLGRIKSLSRIKLSGKKKIGMIYKEIILKPNADDFGYMRVNLWKEKKVKMRKIHQLVADAFLKEDPSKPDINHINGIKSDNRLINLERCTRSYNLKHAYEIGLKKPTWLGKFGKDHHRSLHVGQFSKKGILVCDFDSIRIASQKTLINATCISEAIKGERQKTAGGFIWKIITK